MIEEKSRIRETSNLSTDADCRTDKILESLRDLSRKEKKWAVDASTYTRVHAGALDVLHPPPVFRAPHV